MKKLLPLAIAVAFSAASAAVLGQTPPSNPTDPMRAGESPRCDAMSAEAREQCLKDEAAKTDSKEDNSSSTTSSGSSAAPATGDSPSTAPSNDTSSSGSASPSSSETSK